MDEETQKRIESEMHQFCCRLREKYELDSCVCLATKQETGDDKYKTFLPSAVSGNLYASKFAALRYAK